MRANFGKTWLTRPAATLVCVLLAMPGTQAESPIPAAKTPEGTAPTKSEVSSDRNDAAVMARFLDRLMLAESGGRDDARNPRSTATGPFQFIESTFLDVVRRIFAAETAGLTTAQILAKRTDRAFARRAAEAYTRENAAVLAAAGLEANYANLRLAFFAGSGGAIRVLKAPPNTLAITALGANVVQANPFLAGMTTADLANWSARNLSASDLAQTRVATGPLAAPGSSLAVDVERQRAKPAVAVRCKRGLASCRRWVALATHRAERGKIIARHTGRRIPR